MKRHSEEGLFSKLAFRAARAGRERGRLMISMASLLGAGEWLGADVHHVPAERHAIQAAIDAAAPGDRIVVAPGECIVSEPINLRGKAIALESERGPDATVLVQRYQVPAGSDRCAISRSIIVLESGEPPETVAEGFTLRNGNALGGTGTLVSLSFWCKGEGGLIDAGGGVLIRNGSLPTIVRCRFEEHYAGQGSALAILGSSPTVRDCAFARNRGDSWDCDNSAEIAFSSLGGAVVVADGGTATFEDCLFENFEGENGAGLLVQCGAQALLWRCTFRGNGGGNRGPGLGGAMACIAATLELHECLLERNWAQHSDNSDGGGLWMGPGGEARIFDSTFRGCQATQSGGAIAMDRARLLVERTLFEGNFSSQGAGAILSSGNSQLSLRDCVFHENAASGGGALVVGSESRVEVSNCAFIRNYGDEGAAIWSGGRPEITLESSVIAGSHVGAIDARL